MSSRDFLFDVEFLVAARSLGFSVREIPTVWVDRAGSRLRAGRDGRRMAMSALRLWLHMRILPLPSPAEARPASGLPPLGGGHMLPDVMERPGIDLTEPVAAGSQW